MRILLFLVLAASCAASRAALDAEVDSASSAFVGQSDDPFVTEPRWCLYDHSMEFCRPQPIEC